MVIKQREAYMATHAALIGQETKVSLGCLERTSTNRLVISTTDAQGLQLLLLRWTYRTQTLFDPYPDQCLAVFLVCQNYCCIRILERIHMVSLIPLLAKTR